MKTTTKWLKSLKTMMHYTQNKSKRMNVCSGVEQAKNQSKKPAPIERPAEKI